MSRPFRNIKLVEAGSDFGGVWHWNRYPGARVDSEFPFYQLSIPEVYRTFKFSERFSSDSEIRRYFQHMDKVLNLRPSAIFNTIVEGVTRNGDLWTATTKDTTTKKPVGVITCRYLILCTGSSYKKNFPDFKGLENFSGTLVHSAAYPLEGLNVQGKKVAVVGNGATGVQIIQTLGAEDCELTAYIRTPIIALPMRQRSVSSQEQESLASFYDILLKACRSSKPGFPYGGPSQSYNLTAEHEREALFEELWARGGFSFFLGNYLDFVVDKEVNESIYNFWAKKTRSRVTDPIKREIVAPIRQEHYFGVKRPSLEQNYYEVIDRPNVKIVNLKKTPIQEFTKGGIRTSGEDGHREFDIVILATGYDAMTGSLADLRIQDKEGILLQDKWKAGVETYLGLMVHGMPNMFMVYSPQAPTALSNGPSIIESQVDWIVDALQKMRVEEIHTVEPRKQYAVQWRTDIQDMNAKTLYPLENSWYMGANIPGKVREQLMYIAGVDSYNRAIAQALETWEGFEISKG